MKLRLFAAVAGMVLLTAPLKSLPAELPSVRFDRLTPLGAEAGTTVEVEIVGADIEDVRSLWFDHPGLTAEPIPDRERWFSVTIAADVPQGTYDVRLSGRWGISNPRLFAVSHGIRNVPEAEPNNDRTTIQKIDLNSAVGGMSDGNGQDLFQFEASVGQRIVIDCQAGILDSPMDATMTLSCDGRLLASSSDYHGRDPFIDFTAPQDGVFEVLVHDLSYRGGLPYRLLVTDRPYVENVFPRALQAGQTAEFTALGRNFPEGAQPSSWTLADQSLQQLRFTASAPGDLLTEGRYRFFDHPSAHTVLPTAATCTLTGFQVQPLPGADPAFQPQTILLTDSPVTLESEPNDLRDQPQALTLPVTLSGRFDRDRDADWYAVEVDASGQYAFDVYCERINGCADPYLVVVDDQGNRVTELDDFGHRINAFDGHLRDPSGMIHLNEKRRYFVLVQDRYQRGGVRYQYVLTIHKPRPDFYPAVIHSQNPGPGGTNLWRGGTVYLDVVIHQKDGFNGEITITANGLPQGVHSVPTVINNNSRGTFVLWADDDAPEFTGPIHLMATGQRDDGEIIRREVRSYSRVDSQNGTSQPTRQLLVAVRESAPYRLMWNHSDAECEPGKAVDLKLKLLRREQNWTDDVTVQALAFPGNFSMTSTKFSGDQTELIIPLSVQNGTRPGRYTLALLGQAQVPFNKDSAAADRPKTLVSLPSQPFTIVVKEPVREGS
ncbi:MAG: PPC domain-containing protein [Planctomycetaceae bacterium]